MLQPQHEQHVERGQAHAPDHRQPEEQVQRDGGADHLGEVARGDRHLAENPEDERRAGRVVIAAGLGQVAAAGDPESKRERLQQDRHQVRQHDHAEQRVAELRAAREIGRPVARVHVADRDEIAGAGEGEQLAPEAPGRDRDRPVDLGETPGTRHLPPTHESGTLHDT